MASGVTKSKDAMTNLTPKSLSRLSAYLMQFDPDMPISRLRVFLYVAQRNDTLVRDIVKATGLSQATISRTVSLLADKPQRGSQPGLGWVEAKPDPDDPRRIVLSLSAKGHRVVSEIAELGD